MAVGAGACEAGGAGGRCRRCGRRRLVAAGAVLAPLVAPEVLAPGVRRAGGRGRVGHGRWSGCSCRERWSWWLGTVAVGRAGHRGRCRDGVVAGARRGVSGAAGERDERGGEHAERQRGHDRERDDRRPSRWETPPGACARRRRSAGTTPARGRAARRTAGTLASAGGGVCGRGRGRGEWRRSRARAGGRTITVGWSGSAGFAGERSGTACRRRRRPVEERSGCFGAAAAGRSIVVWSIAAGAAGDDGAGAVARAGGAAGGGLSRPWVRGLPVLGSGRGRGAGRVRCGGGWCDGGGRSAGRRALAGATGAGAGWLGAALDWGGPATGRSA